MTLDVPEQIQLMIQDERKKLDQERENLWKLLAENRKKINVLMKRCSHPNAVSGEMYGKYPTTDCPDCGYGHVDLRTPAPRRGRPSK